MYPGSHYLSASLHAAQVFPKKVQKEASPERILQSISLMTGESSCSPCRLNPLTGSPCLCRRSPRLLTNGYYDMSDESFMDQEGNLTLTPSKINISYKENLVRISLMTGESSCSPCRLNPLTGSPCLCRRSPRLLTNGYYDMSDESFMDQEGNLTLTPSKINISYKENLVRIFRRRRKARRSFASLFSIDSSSAWLNRSLFSRSDCPLAESSWIGDESDFDTNFTNIHGQGSADLSPTNKSWLLEDTLPLINAEGYSTEDRLGDRSEGILELSSHSQIHPAKYCFNKSPKSPDYMTIKNFFFHLIILALSISIAIFASCFLGGVIAALIITMLLFTAVLTTAKSAYPCFIKSQEVLHLTQTEEITPTQG
ncbi:transmembrane protein 71 isoform X1 [Amblyraja radiata]|uniref:transmembrane protein 71 isoform X1 n=1 Tax=Amblyraja radiata TaxID=386614 RepID=UPI0014038571|nr:transmembrane protein 71 isoform X1 [Amblyraja radiata]XP_032876235.1 transmembrane protein 71 isoform X1 [Amblyraja radiata]